MITKKNGYVLYLVSILLSIAAIFFSLSLRATGFSNKLAIFQSHKIQAKLLAKSGLARIEFFFNGGDNHDLGYETSFLKEQVFKDRNYMLSCTIYGAYALAISTGKMLTVSQTVRNCIGRNIPEVLSPTLTLTGHIGGLTLDKGSSIQGSVVLHHGIISQKKSGSAVLGSQINTSNIISPQLPFSLERIDNTITKAMNLISKTDTIPKSDKNPVIKLTANTFVNHLDTFFVQGDCYLDSISLKTKVIITNGAVLISEATQLSECFIAAKNSIVIENANSHHCMFFSAGTQRILSGVHSSQFITTDSLYINKSAVFSGVNVWISKMTLKENSIKGGLFFDGAGIYQGHALSYCDTTQTHKFDGPFVVLADKSSFTGTIITNGNLQMKHCEMQAHIWARTIQCVEDEKGYVNWIVGCKIKPSEEYIPFPLFGTTPLKILFF